MIRVLCTIVLILPFGPATFSQTSSGKPVAAPTVNVDQLFANQEEMGSLMFTRDRNRVSGFLIRSGKVRNLRFNKINSMK